jgi:hypothetical protein
MRYKSFLDKRREEARKMAIEALIGMGCMVVFFGLMVWALIWFK